MKNRIPQPVFYFPVHLPFAAGVRQMFPASPWILQPPQSVFQPPVRALSPRPAWTPPRQGQPLRQTPQYQTPVGAANPPAPKAPASPAPKVSAHDGLTPERFTARGLSQADLDAIISKYGDEIDDIFDLAPGQAWMFGRARRVTSAFFIQDLIKLTLKLKPSTFRQRLDAISLKRSNLRTAFAYRGQRTPYQVVLKNRRPELRFVDRSDLRLAELEEELEQLRAADRRRGFDLERDALLRITVISTADEDTYAMIVSQPHINHDGASIMALYKEMLIDYALEGRLALPELAAGSYQDYAKYLQGIDREAELRYWEHLLDGCAMTRLPGRIQSALEPAINNLVLRFDGEQGAKAAALPGRYRATLNSVVQSAWGVMLQRIYGTEDAVFGSITSGRAAEVANSGTMTGGFINAFPVRVSAEPGEPFSALVSRTQMQIARSLQQAHCSPDEIGARLGRKEPVFDHLVNFHNFADMTHEMPALPGISILSTDCFDNLSTGFCLYLRQEKDGLNCTFSYDRRAFPERKIRILSGCFRQIMEQLLADERGDITVDALRCPDLSAFITAQRDEEEERARLESFLRRVPLFDGVDEAGISALAEQTEVLTCAEGDELLREKQPCSGIQIVMEGRVQLSKTTLHGWENPLILRKPGQSLSVCGLLERAKSHTSARAVRGQTRIAQISQQSMVRFMEQYPVVARSLLREQEELVKALSFLWINAQ